MEITRIIVSVLILVSIADQEALWAKSDEHQISSQLPMSYPFDLVARLTQSVEQHWHPALTDSPYGIDLRFTVKRGTVTSMNVIGSDNPSDSAAVKEAIEAVHDGVADMQWAQSIDSVDCCLGFESHAPQRRDKSQIYDFVPRVSFIPPENLRRVSPNIARYYSNGRPELWYYAEHAIRMLSRIWNYREETKQPARLRISVSADGKYMGSELLSTSGSHTLDRAALKAASEANYSTLPSPGPKSINLTVTFSLGPRLESFEAIYNDSISDAGAVEIRPTDN